MDDGQTAGVPRSSAPQFCNIRCSRGHDCVFFANGAFNCVPTADLMKLPPGADCSHSPQTNYSIRPDQLKCGEGLRCRAGFCKYRCPTCPPGKENIILVYPENRAHVCCGDGTWGTCSTAADCGGKNTTWGCDWGVCVPPWRKTSNAERSSTAVQKRGERDESHVMESMYLDVDHIAVQSQNSSFQRVVGIALLLAAVLLALYIYRRKSKGNAAFKI